MRIKDNFRRLKQLTYILIFIIYKGWENFMDLLIGTLFLILVLIIFTLFTYKAPNGMRAMGALANAAIATFLVEAFNKYVGGEVFGIKFLEELGDRGRSRRRCAAGLTALAIGVSPVYALVIGAPVVAWISYQVSSQGTLSVTL